MTDSKIKCPHCGESEIRKIDYIDSYHAKINWNKQTVFQDWKCHCKTCDKVFTINLYAEITNINVVYN